MTLVFFNINKSACHWNIISFNSIFTTSVLYVLISKMLLKLSFTSYVRVYNKRKKLDKIEVICT